MIGRGRKSSFLVFVIEQPRRKLTWFGILLYIFTSFGIPAFAQDFGICTAEAEADGREEVNFRDHGLGFVSFETQENQKSFTAITYSFIDCATGDTLSVEFLESHRKKKAVKGTNVSALAISIREIFDEMVPSWGNNLEVLGEKLSTIDAEFETQLDLPQTCACKTAYPEIVR